MKKRNTGIVALVLIFLTLSFNVHAVEDDAFFLSPKRLTGKIKDKFAEIDLGWSLKLLRFDIFEGMNIAARYKYEVERSHRDGFHSRIDKWKVEMKLNPGDIIGGGLPINFSVRKGTNIYFVRQFKKKIDAIKALPYTPKRMPITAKIAKEKLNVGDFVSIPSRMTFVIGINKNIGVPPMPGSVNAFYMLSGDFIVNIIRMKDDKVQVRLIAQNGKSTGGGGKLGYDFKAFEIGVLGRAIKKVIDLDLVKIGFSKGKGNQFVLDYIYDLNDPKAAKAYK